MRRILILFTASLLLLACSNDDDNVAETPQALKIKKYTSISFDENGNPNGERVEYFFDENGKKTKDHIVDLSGDYVWEYTYNTMGQVTKKTHNHTNYAIDFVENYIYSDNKLFVIFRDRDNDGIEVDSISFTYQPNQINSQWFTPSQDRTEFYYNNAGVLDSVKHKGDLGIVSDEIITYDGSFNITKLNVTTDYFNSESNHDYVYDGKINPFYEEFHNFHFNIDYYGYLSAYPLFISPSNATKITRTGSDFTENFIIETTYQYNGSDYPVSSQSKLNGVLSTQGTFEYY